MTLRARSRDAGETLVELVVAITLMGIGGVAVVGGVAMIRRDSTRQAELSTSYSLVTSFSEQLSNLTWQPCSSPDLVDAYQAEVAPLITSMTTADQIPANYQPKLNDVLCWDAATSTYAATAPTSSQLQRFDVQVTSPDGQVLKLSVVRRDPAEVATPPAGGGAG